MAKSAKERIDNWLVRMQGEAMSDNARRVLDPTNGLSTASTNAYKNATESMCAYEEQAREILSNGGVQTILFPAYLAFLRQLYRLTSQGYSVNTGKGSPGYLQARTLKADWVSRGLDPKVLDGIMGLF